MNWWASQKCVVDGDGMGSPPSCNYCYICIYNHLIIERMINFKMLAHEIVEIEDTRIRMAVDDVGITISLATFQWQRFLLRNGRRCGQRDQGIGQQGRIQISDQIDQHSQGARTTSDRKSTDQRICSQLHDCLSRFVRSFRRHHLFSDGVI